METWGTRFGADARPVWRRPRKSDFRRFVDPRPDKYFIVGAVYLPNDITIEIKCDRCGELFTWLQTLGRPPTCSAKNILANHTPNNAAHVLVQAVEINVQLLHLFDGYEELQVQQVARPRNLGASAPAINCVLVPIVPIQTWREGWKEAYCVPAAATPMEIEAAPRPWAQAVPRRVPTTPPRQRAPTGPTQQRGEGVEEGDPAAGVGPGRQRDPMLPGYRPP